MDLGAWKWMDGNWSVYFFVCWDFREVCEGCMRRMDEWNIIVSCGSRLFVSK